MGQDCSAASLSTRLGLSRHTGIPGPAAERAGRWDDYELGRAAGVLLSASVYQHFLLGYDKPAVEAK